MLDPVRPFFDHSRYKFRVSGLDVPPGDRDTLATAMFGYSEPPQNTANFSLIELSDEQVDTLLCALAELPIEDTSERSAEACFQLAYAAMREASAAGLIADPQREAVVRQHLAQA